MIVDRLKYTYKDVFIVPEAITNIKSRKDVNPYHFTDTNDFYLPIFTAPMSCLVDEKNYKCFDKNHIYSILPTTLDIDFRLDQFAVGQWTAFSINEVKNNILYNKDYLRNLSIITVYHICIDCANGHMQQLIDLCKELKSEFKKLKLTVEIMTGNIANPGVLEYYLKASIDYVRCGIGGGSGCTTTSNTGVHYPMASLINECRKELRILYSKYGIEHKVNLIADGGIRNYDDVTKALALGADYVMMGGLLTECVEAAGSVFTYNHFEHEFSEVLSGIDFLSMTEQEKRNCIKRDGYTFFYHEVYGMSTKRAQKERGYESLKTSEGTQHFMKIQYTLKQWSENMDSYLRSAMSYTDCNNLQEFTSGDVNLVVSTTTQNTVNK